MVFLFFIGLNMTQCAADVCIVIIRISKRSVLKRICGQGKILFLFFIGLNMMQCATYLQSDYITHLIMTSNRWVGCSIFSFRVFPLFLGIPFWPPSWALTPYEFRVTKMTHITTCNRYLEQLARANLTKG